MDELIDDTGPALRERVYGHLGRIDPAHLSGPLADLLPRLRERLAELQAEKAAWR